MPQFDRPRNVGLCPGAEFSRVHGLRQQGCLLPVVRSAAGTAWAWGKS